MTFSRDNEGKATGQERARKESNGTHGKAAPALRANRYTNYKYTEWL